MKLHRKCLWFLPLCIVIGIAAGFSACTPKKEVAGPSIRILTYSSLGSKGGFLESVKEEFKTVSQCSIEIETTLGAAQVLSYLDEPKQRDRIDLVMGVDQLLFERAKSAFYLADPPATHPKEMVLPVLKEHAQPGFIPVDYGALSFIYRKADLKGKTLPTNLSDLLKPEFKHKWIVQDPRASSPGMLFFLFADSTLVRIKDMKKQWATLAPSWDASYKMFLAHDSSMVWSYLTSLAYHASKGELDQYGYLDFKEGLPLQIEGMAVLNRVGNPYTANPCLEKWVQFILKPETQSKLVAKQFMMPVVPNVTLPKFFENVPAIKKAANLEFTLEKVDQLVSRFGREVQGDSL
jgi:thiamine transport system substrate-binding protein